MPAPQRFQARETPGVASQEAVNNYAWANPNNILASDNLRASVSLDGSTWSSHHLKGTGYGFAIPSNAIIQGIEVHVEGYTSNSHLNQMRAVKGGVRQATNVITTALPSGSEGVVTQGNPTNLWGTMWTPADVNDSGFGCALTVFRTNSAAIGYCYVDRMGMTVYFQVPGGPRMVV